jgi:outer membrane protein assembly factor BamD (BamD/ComL family)
MGDIYAVKLQDYKASLDAYNQFIERFGKDERLLDVYYSCYRTAGKANDSLKQEFYRNIIVEDYPESKYAIILSQPDYLEKMHKMYAQQDSLYRKTYEAYSRGSFDTVMGTYEYMNKEYPLSTLMPKFSLLNALSIGRTRPEEELITALNDIVSRYPNSNVTPMSKDILALLTQGREAQQGNITSTIAQTRTVGMANIIDPMQQDSLVFSDEMRTRFKVIIIPKETNDTTLNSLLYDIAAFNFTKFLVKDFDIARENIDGKKAIVISGMENYDEALWYESMLLSEPMLQGRVTLDVCERIVISETNLGVINQGLTWGKYKEFIKSLPFKKDGDKKNTN